MFSPIPVLLAAVFNGNFFKNSRQTMQSWESHKIGRRDVAQIIGKRENMKKFFGVEPESRFWLEIRSRYNADCHQARDFSSHLTHRTTQIALTSLKCSLISTLNSSEIFFWMLLIVNSDFFITFACLHLNFNCLWSRWRRELIYETFPSRLNTSCSSKRF